MKCIVQGFSDTYLVQAKELLNEHPDIFANQEIELYRQDLLDYLKEEKNLIKIFIARLHHDIQGLIAVHKVDEAQNYFKIEWIVVRKDMQRNGVGSILMEEVVRWVREKQGKYIFVETSNERHNEKAKNFYEKHGFKKVGVLPNYFAPPLKHRKTPEDCIVYLKEL